jgi:hypothetical protein
MPTPMIEDHPDRSNVRLDLINEAIAALGRDTVVVATNVRTYLTHDLEADGRPEFVVTVDDWGVAQFAGELALRCAELGLTRECRTLLACGHMTQITHNHRSVLSFGGWTLVDLSGMPVSVPLRPLATRRGDRR